MKILKTYLFLGFGFRVSGNLKIVGGHDVDISMYPWQVALHNGNEFFGAGVLISPSWVLTSPSCLKHKTAQNIIIRAGSTSWKSGGQTVAVKRIVMSGESSLEQRNLALLELSSPVTIRSAKPATLPQNGSDVSDNALVNVIGWGGVNASAYYYPTTLQGISVPVVTRFYCKKQYEGKFDVTEEMFCASVTGGKGPCFGDEGGSVSVGQLVVGIINSWGSTCTLTSNSAIFMRIGLYRDWIKKFAGV